KPNRYPPASDGQYERVTWRHSRNAVHAASAGARIIPALYEATAPALSVTGASAAASAGTEEAHVRSRPTGGQTACVTTGFCQWRTACGHQASDQTKICGSAPVPIQSCPKRETTGSPKSPNETATYAASAPQALRALRASASGGKRPASSRARRP